MKPPSSLTLGFIILNLLSVLGAVERNILGIDILGNSLEGNCMS